jgi:hypothetical protein
VADSARQKAWREKRKAAGLCSILSHDNPIHPASKAMCLPCLIRMRDKARDRLGCSRRINARSYAAEREAPQ